MHPTVALSVVLLSWCLVRNRSRQARLLLGIVAALLGWEPAMGGNRSGVVLLLIAAGLGVSLVWDLVSDRLGGTPWPRPAFASAPPPPPPPSPPAAPPPPAPAASQAPGTVGPQPRPAQPVARRIRLRRTRPRGGHSARPMPGVTYSTPPPPVPPPPSQSPPPGWSQSQRRRVAGEPLTDLERAEAYGDLLEANLEGLVDAYRNGDVRAQAAFAGEIADVAHQMEAALRVVVGERHRVQGGGSLPHPGAP